MNFIYKYRLRLILPIIKFVLPFLLQHLAYGFHRDEFLYIEEGNHLAWGFMEIPPLLAVFAKVALMMGGSFFWIKFWPCFFGALNVFIVCMMTREMGGKSFAQVVAGLTMIAGVYLRTNYLFQPNFLEIFFWTLAIYFIILFINKKANKYLYLLAISIALGWLSKYSVAFLVAGIVVGTLLTSNRKLFLNKHVYLAALLALALVTPNLIWQYLHKWPVIHHMKELRETQLQYISSTDFLKDQLLMHLPTFFVWIGGLVWLAFYKAGKQYRVLVFIYLTVILLLIASNGKSYYSLGVYPMLFAAGGVWLQQVIKASNRWIRYASVAVILLIFIPIIPLGLPVWRPEKLANYYRKAGMSKTGFLKWEDLQNHPLPQDFADMLGWKELGEKVSAVYASLPDTVKNKTMIYGSNYGFAGSVTYYGRNLSHVNSTNGSFLFWMPDKYNIRNLLLISRDMPDKDEPIFQQFEKVTILDSLTTPFARERGTKIILYQNGNEKLNTMIEAAIKQKKDEFRR